MRAAVSMTCGVTARACFVVCLHVSSVAIRHNCSFLLCWSLWTTTLDGSLLWSPYLPFDCSVKLCKWPLWSPILWVQRPALPTPRRNWFTEVMGQVSFFTEVPLVCRFWLLAACRAGSRSQGCHGTSMLCLVFSRGPHQLLIAPVPKLINWGWV